MKLSDLTGTDIAEILHHTADLVTAAGATWLTLGALIFILASATVSYLMRRAQPRIRLASFCIWVVFCLAVLLIIAWISYSPPRLAFLNLLGQGQIEGRNFLLDLGDITAGQASRFELGIQPASNARDASWTSSTPAITAHWKSDEAAKAAPADAVTPFIVQIAADAQSGDYDLFFAANAQPLFKLRVRLVVLPGTVTQTNSSGPKPSGRGQDFSEPYSTCVEAPSAGEYDASSWNGDLTGDRSCGGFSTCSFSTSPKKVCFIFTLQGHNECLGLFSHCDPIGMSEGHVAASFQLHPSAPRLSVLPE